VGVARLSPPLLGGLGCNWPRGVQDDPSDEAPEVEDMGEDEPSRMGGESAEAYCAGVAAPVLEAAEGGVAPDSDLDELGTVDKIDVVDKSCGLFCVSSAAAATASSAAAASAAVAEA